MTDNIENKEVEEIDEVSIINVPFDPNEIKVSTQPYTLGEIIDRLEYNEIKMDTEFQRHPDLWNDKKKSRLIESILLKLPIPSFYFDGQDDNKWRVVDGLQRISTLRSFILDEKPLLLQDLEFLKEFEGFSYKKLPRDLQRRIRTFPITVYIIEKGTPDIVKFNIFSRINQGGLVLTAQEIRHALHQGAASKLVADMVREKDYTNGEGELVKATEEGKIFAHATQWKIQSIRMQDRDFAARFVAFYLVGFQNYEPDLDSFLNTGMAKVNTLTLDEIEQIKLAFKKSMRLALDVFGEDAFRKRMKIGDARKPINKALFDIISVLFAKLSESEMLKIKNNKALIINKMIVLTNNPDGRFLRAISQGTALKENVNKRFELFENIIKEVLAI